MNFIRILSTIALLFWNCWALFAVELAITLDDHPMPKGNLFSINERVTRFCNAFEKYGCKGAFFCIGSYCLHSQDLSCLIGLTEKGHFLANHSLNHRHLSSISLQDLKNEIEETEAILCSYSQFRKWFRFPYLDYGNRLQIGGSEEKFSAAMDLLKELGYQEGFVTINTSDWYLDSCLHKAIQENKNINYLKLKEAYLYLLNEWCEYHIALYKKIFSDEVTHVLLLHANDLNALFLNDILEMVHRQGWSIVSPEKAFSNPPWRKRILERPELIIDTPPSLNCQYIDQVLKAYRVFS